MSIKNAENGFESLIIIIENFYFGIYIVIEVLSSSKLQIHK